MSDEETEFITGTKDIEEGCRKLIKTAKLVICTCGENGCYAFAPSEKVKACDTAGAGDAFIGSFLYSLHRNGCDKAKLHLLTDDKLREFLKASSAYCGKSVQKYGAIESYPDSI